LARNHLIESIPEALYLLFNTAYNMKKPLSSSQKSTVFQILEKAGLASPFGMQYNTKKIRFSYFLNPDGSIRWMWLEGSTHPSCLAFYNVGTLKAQLFALVCRLAFWLRKERLIRHGVLEVFLSPQGAQQLQPDMAFFTGTPGPNRKAIVYERNPEGEWIFRKIPLGIYGKLQIENERKMLEEVKGLELKNLSIPQLTAVGLKSVKHPGAIRMNTLASPHLAALDELYRKTCVRMPLQDSEVWKKTGFYLQQVQHLRCYPNSLRQKLNRLYQLVDASETYSFTLAHQDFTPWNLYVREQHLYAYDWEMASFASPLLFDAFHFIFQQGILVARKPLNELLLLVRVLHQHPIVCRWVPDRASFEKYYHLYLLSNISYYLLLYKQQPQWHEQVHWLLKTWEDALDEALLHYQTASMREVFLEELFSFLDGKKYALLRFHATDVRQLPLSSDLDICIRSHDIPQVHAFLESHPLIDKVRSIRLSYMTTTELYFKDGGFLSVDWLIQFRRKHLEMMSATELLSWSRPTTGGVLIPGRLHDLLYCQFFYLLNGNPVPDKHHHFFYDLNALEQEAFLDFMQVVCQDKALSISNWYQHTPDRERALEAYLKSLHLNKGMAGLRNQLNYLLDACKDKLLRRGLVITFSGVDGAGKSTVIEQLKQALQAHYRKKVVVLRHRPSLLPILSAWKYGKQQAEALSSASLPRQGSNTNLLSSLFRFAYYLTDYLMGQFYVRLRYVARGYVVLYDRYYFDLIGDARRSNILLPPAFTSWFYWLLLKPDLNFFLYAPADTILSRKQELDKATIEGLTRQYLGLFEKLHRQYPRSRHIALENQSLPHTTALILSKVREIA
jgi:thymidylate kinase